MRVKQSAVLLVAGLALAGPVVGQERPAPAAALVGSQAPRPLSPWLDAVAAGLGRIESMAASGRLDDARQAALRLYLDEYELLESTYGVAGGRSNPALQQRIAQIEARFHELLRAPDAPQARVLAAGVRGEVLALRAWAEAHPAGGPSAPVVAGESLAAAALAAGADVGRPSRWSGRGGAGAETPELRAVVAQLDTAEAVYRAGRPGAALARVERMYLEGIEPLESRLPQERVGEIERLVHLGVRAGIGAGAPAHTVVADFDALRGRLLDADRLLAAGAPAWLGAANAFIILVREGLEAVLLLAALLAYLAASGAGRRERRQVYAGAGAGVVATIATCAVADLLIPISGASRELVEGITGLLAVAVLLYVSNWLFQKTYIQDWKDYLREHAGRAASTGSALAMAALAFAAVYREGFETVLFYQALLFNAGYASVLMGALPGALVIGAIGVGIIRMGVKLPLRKVFAVTNAILLYLAFTFVGKGLYSLQEAGLFAPHALHGVPDLMPLRQLLGIYPIAETLLAQLIFAAGVALTYVYYRRQLARAGTATAAGTAPDTSGPSVTPPAAISLPPASAAPEPAGRLAPGLQRAGSRAEPSPDRRRAG